MAIPAKPSTKLGWWALWLGVATVLWGLFAPSIPMVLRPFMERGGPRPIPVSLGMATVAIAVLLAVSAIAVGITALVKRDRSWIGIAGLTLAGLSGGFWLTFAIGEALIPH